MGKIGVELSPLLKMQLGSKSQINILTAQAIQQGLFGNDDITLIEGRMQKVVEAKKDEHLKTLEQAINADRPDP